MNETETAKAERAERTERALRTIRAAVESGSILKVDFDEAKRTLDGAAHGSFRAATESFWAGKGGKLSEDFETNRVLNEMNWNVSVSYARDAIAAAKKLAKVKLAHPMVDAYRSAVAAVLPIAEALEAAKPLVVKGRRPNPEAEARKAARLASVESMDRATCGCCFGEQAVLPNGKIHDHGYRIPRTYQKSGSCFGRKFRPLEVSNEGPLFMVDYLARAEASTVAALATTPEAISFERRGKVETVRPGDADWARRLAARNGELESDLRSIRSDLAEFRKVVAEWKPAK